MICKRGNKDCQMIGCDCYRTAPIEEIDAELEAAGINLSDLEKRTKTVVRLSMELCNRDAEIERLKAKLEERERALETASMFLYIEPKPDGFELIRNCGRGVLKRATDGDDDGAELAAYLREVSP